MTNALFCIYFIYIILIIWGNSLLFFCVCDVIKVQTLFKAFTLTVYELQSILYPVLPFFRDSNIIWH